MNGTKHGTEAVGITNYELRITNGKSLGRARHGVWFPIRNF